MLRDHRETSYGTPHRGLLNRVAPTLVGRMRPLIDSRRSASLEPFGESAMMRPHLGSKLWGWTHFGAFLPDLPHPFRYLNTMTFIGTPGVLAFDNGTLAAIDVRENATVLTSTAHGDMYFYEAFDAAKECALAADGSQLRWGDALTWRTDFPEVQLTGRYGPFDADITLRATEQVSYFVRTPIYQHFSLLAPYQGVIEYQGETTEISGLGTIEYARCVSPQVFSAKPVSPWARIPVDFFTYQVVRINETTQILLTDVRAAGASACLSAHIRTMGGTADVVEEGVTFEVLAYQDQDAVDPEGRTMRVPSVMRWTIPQHGHLDAVVDAPLRYGHGLGYVSSYSFTGQWRGEAIAGSGYFEWVDLLTR